MIKPSIRVGKVRPQGKYWMVNLYFLGDRQEEELIGWLSANCVLPFRRSFGHVLFFSHEDAMLFYMAFEH